MASENLDDESLSTGVSAAADARITELALALVRTLEQPAISIGDFKRGADAILADVSAGNPVRVADGRRKDEKGAVLMRSSDLLALLKAIEMSA